MTSILNCQPFSVNLLNDYLVRTSHTIDVYSKMFQKSFRAHILEQFYFYIGEREAQKHKRLVKVVYHDHFTNLWYLLK